MKLSQVIEKVRNHKGPVVVWCPAWPVPMNLPLNKAAVVRELTRNMVWLQDHDTGWELTQFDDTLVIDTSAVARSMT